MCGIVAAVSRRGTAPGSESGGAPGVGAVAVASLARLQYRGYDSFGFAIAGDGELNCYRSLEALDDFVEEMPAGIAAIGHTRWATHGPVSIENCHPITPVTAALHLFTTGLSRTTSCFAGHCWTMAPFLIRGPTPR